ncbi:MAG TPA: hypothetical protein V6D08_09975 [Candidatus Obscuribacterales bacterium]
MAPNQAQQITSGTYWYLVSGEGWQPGETTYDPALPIPVLRPVGCVAVGVCFTTLSEPGRRWRLLWTWRDETAVRENINRYGDRPPAIDS